jgi:ABC-type antimicrobial peptide transport system permease subunit
MFAIAALLLAAVGLFGVSAILVAQRTREIGVRVASARRSGIFASMILKQAGTWTWPPGHGLGGVLAAMRPLKSLLFAVDPADPATIAAVMLLLALIAALAAWIPARRASRVDPMRALRGLTGNPFQIAENREWAISSSFLLSLPDCLRSSRSGRLRPPPPV